MIYSFEITTPANTPLSNMKKTVMKLAKGTTYRIEILFPPGPCGLLHVQISDALHQVWPTNAGEFFTTDDETISFNDELVIGEPPYELQAYTYNEDDTYDHTLWIRIGLKEKAEEYILSLADLEAMAAG